jgi:hypothetical protein
MRVSGAAVWRARWAQLAETWAPNPRDAAEAALRIYLAARRELWKRVRPMRQAGSMAVWLWIGLIGGLLAFVSSVTWFVANAIQAKPVLLRRVRQAGIAAAILAAGGVLPLLISTASHSV